MFRNENGAVFPYNISNCVSITGTNASLGYYYFFYDWEIEVQSCYSNISQSNISVNSISINYDTLSICLGDSVLVGSNYYYSAGIYNDTLLNSYGCDSVINTNLIINSSIYISNYDTICDGQSIIAGVNLYNQSGVYTDILTSSTGCDSIINTNLLVLNNSSFQQNINLCNGESLQVGLNTYNISGNYIDTLVSYNGCDSIILTSLSFYDNFSSSSIETICFGDSLSIGQSTYFSPGSYIDSLYSFFGCDSIIFTSLSVYPILYEYLNYTLCDGDSVEVGNNTYYNSGIYSDTLLSSIFCDSIITTVIDESIPVSTSR